MQGGQQQWVPVGTTTGSQQDGPTKGKSDGGSKSGWDEAYKQQQDPGPGEKGGWADSCAAGKGKASKSGGWDDQAQSQKGYDGWDYWDYYWQDWSNTGYKGWSGKGAKKKKGGKGGKGDKGKKEWSQAGVPACDRQADSRVSQKRQMAWQEKLQVDKP